MYKEKPKFPSLLKSSRFLNCFHRNLRVRHRRFYKCQRSTLRYIFKYYSRLKNFLLNSLLPLFLFTFLLAQLLLFYYYYYYYYYQSSPLSLSVWISIISKIYAFKFSWIYYIAYFYYVMLVYINMFLDTLIYIMSY